MLITGQLPYFIRPGISFNKRPRSNFALQTKHIFATLQLAPTSYFLFWENELPIILNYSEVQFERRTFLGTSLRYAMKTRLDSKLSRHHWL